MTHRVLILNVMILYVRSRLYAKEKGRISVFVGFFALAAITEMLQHFRLIIAVYKQCSVHTHTHTQIHKAETWIVCWWVETAFSCTKHASFSS